MPDSPLSDAITDAAGTPLKMAGDEGSVEQRSLKELIATDSYLAGVAARKAGRTGLTIRQMKPPGAV